MKRVVVLVNKDFEYKGFIEGLRDTVPVYAGTNGRDAECRFDNLIADIYCIQHLFGEGENSSNSEVKYGHLKELFKSNVFRIHDVDGVLSVSTSESTPDSQFEDDEESRNGCVFIGTKFFLSDQRLNDSSTTSHLDIGNEKTQNTEVYFEKPLCVGFLGMLREMPMRLVHAPLNPTDYVMCEAGAEFACVGVVNVMDYACYNKSDEAAYGEYLTKPYSKGFYAVGIETTHGVVVKALKDTCQEIMAIKDIPVNFVSPIVDRYLKFDEDVDGTDGKQNFICSYNGGVVVGNMLKILAMA